MEFPPFELPIEIWVRTVVLKEMKDVKGGEAEAQVKEKLRAKLKDAKVKEVGSEGSEGMKEAEWMRETRELILCIVG